MDYRNSASGVEVNLSTGVALDGFGGTDTLVNLERIRGSEHADILIGDAGNNVLNGRAGDDFLDGGAGTDEIRYNNNEGAATVDLAAGTALDGQGGTDTFVNVENVRGSSLGDDLRGDANGNALLGGGGDDLLEGRGGFDFIDGSSGSDTAVFSGNRSDYVLTDIGGGQISVQDVNAGDGDDGTDTLRGVEFLQFADVTVPSSDLNDAPTGNDTILGGDGFDSIRGDSGDDVIDGGANDDFIRGGSGSDTIDDGTGFDSVSYSNEGPIIANLSATLQFGVAAGSISDGTGGTDIVTNIESVFGSNFNDIMIGGAQSDNLNGGSGDDTLLGGDGFDFLVGEAENDILDGQGGSFNTAYYANDPSSVVINLSDVFQFGAAAKTALDGYGGVDTLIDINNVNGSGFNDTLIGSDRTDVGEIFHGEGGDDFIDGAGGFDNLDYFSSTDGVTVDLGNQGVAQSISASQGTDTFQNMEGVASSFHDDVLTGSAADEYFEARGGDDTIDAGGGADNILGGAGDDLFNFDTGDGADRIQDFQAGAGSEDIIDLIGVTGLNSFVDVLANATDTVNGAQIDAGGGDSILLDNVLVSQLHEDDFLF